jgi:hypothetical protein
MLTLMALTHPRIVCTMQQHAGIHLKTTAEIAL